MTKKIILGLVLIGIILTSLSCWSVDAPIYSISRETTLNGRFLLGSGFVNDEATYFLYAQWDDGIKLLQIPARKAIIVETDGVPHIKGSHDKYGYWYSASIYVPRGTIIREFQLR